MREANEIRTAPKVRWLHSRTVATLGTTAIGIIAAVAYWKVAKPIRFIDFYQAYYPAGVGLWRSGPAALEHLFNSAGFVNIPVLAWLLVPFAAFGPTTAALLFTVLGLIAVAVAWRMLLSLGQHATEFPVTLLLVLNGPLWYSINLGNTTHFVFLLLVGSLVLMRRDRRFLAGCVIGVSAMIKLPLLLFAPCLLIRKDLRCVLGLTATVALIVVASIIFCGPGVTLDWWKDIVLRFLGRPMPAYNVQSIDSFILRLVPGGFPATDWQPHDITLAARLAGYLAIIGVGLCMLASYGRKVPQPQSDYLVFSSIIAASLLISTVSWTHYYLLLLIPWTLYFTGSLPLKRDRTTSVLMWASVVLASFPILAPISGPAWFIAIASRTVASIWLFGGLLLLIAMARGGRIQLFWRRQAQPG